MYLRYCLVNHCHKNLNISSPTFRISWRITLECNLNCVFCTVREREFKFMPVNAEYPLKKETVVKMIMALYNFIKSSGRSLEINFTGGEPCLRPDIIELSHLFNKLNIRLSLDTNGTMSSDSLWKIILNNYSNITISIDGPERVHDKVRSRKGTFKKVIINLEKLCKWRKLLKNKIIVKTNTVITNIFSDDDIVSFVKKITTIGVDYMYFVPLKKEFCSKNSLFLGLSLSEVKKKLQLLQKLQKEYHQIVLPIDYIMDSLNYQNKGMTKSSMDCGSGKNFIHIDSFGQVWPCCMYSQNNIIPYKFQEAFKLFKKGKLSEEFQSLNETLNNPCRQCSIKRLMSD